MLLPLPLIANVLLGIFSLLLIPLGFFLLYHAIGKIQRYNRETAFVPSRREDSLMRVRTRWWRVPALVLPLALGILLPLISFGGRNVIQYAFPTAADEPKEIRSSTSQVVKGTGGSNLRVETYGKADGPILLFTHGWSMDSTEWYYAKRDLSPNFRLILWDLPGLGESDEPADRDFALEQLARNLRAVVATADGKPVILVGHSIGGMINLTFCRLFPELLGTQVVGIAQVDTSYTNPVKTTKNSGVSQALQKPVAEPILHAIIGLSPLVRLMNFLSYENGSMYLMNAQSAFAGAESRGQLDLVSHLQMKASPAVVARGTLAMFHWDADPVLPHVDIPVLLLVGLQDSTTLPEASRHMQQAIPHARLQEIDRAAHYSLLEQNESVDSAIRQFAATTFRTKSEEPTATPAGRSLP